MPTICAIPGDGIGQEVIPAAVEVLSTLSLGLTFEEAPAGYSCFQESGSALPEATLELARNADAVLFGATASPFEPVAGYRSPILALRAELDLYANLRPVYSLPGEYSRTGIDLLIVRENSECLYSGRERLEGDTAIAERVITRQASQRIARLAFEQALLRAQGRDRPPSVTVVHKANVLKLSDGLFRRCVLQVAKDFPQVEVREMLVDSAAMQLILSPERFDIIVTTNLFGDILSDEASALVGGLGVAASANLGSGTPLFEPVHGSAPEIAGKGVANPVAALFSTALLLESLDEPASAHRLRMALWETLTSGLRTPDLGGRATTSEFTRAVCRRL
jgi:homoisocitrate dehydrogenase